MRGRARWKHAAGYYYYDLLCITSIIITTTIYHYYLLFITSIITTHYYVLLFILSYAAGGCIGRTRWRTWHRRAVLNKGSSTTQSGQSSIANCALRVIDTHIIVFYVLQCLLPLLICCSVEYSIADSCLLPLLICCSVEYSIADSGCASAESRVRVPRLPTGS